jgi:hypothetical protein
VVFSLLLFSGSAWSQTTGSIRGKTVDADGQALPGVMIVVTGEVLGSAQRGTVTSSSGGFSFPAIPIGTYTVTASLEGFQTQAAEEVRVAIGSVAEVDFTMPEAFSDEITVVAETPIVDMASSAYSAGFDADQLKDLPTRGNFYDAITVTPGITQDGEGKSQISAFGADVQSNKWNIDGLDMTSPETGELYWSMNQELIQEIQVLGTGSGAEYGGMLGTTFNVVTKSGSNEFHGSAVLDYWNPNWVDENARREDAPEGAQTYRLDKDNNLTLTLGGPIVKDTLWFFVAGEWGRWLAYQPFEEESPDQKETTWDNYDAKLTTQIGNNHRLNLRAFQHKYVRPWVGSVYDEPTTRTEDYQNDKMVALDYSAVLGASTLLEVRGGKWWGDVAYRAQNPTDEWMFVDKTVDPWVYSGGTYWTWAWWPETDDAEIILTQHADDFIKGDHEFRFGVQYTAGVGPSNHYDPGYYYQRDYYSYYYYNYYTYQYFYGGLPYYYGAETESIGAFVTDSWRISDKLTLNLGVRYDRHEGRIPDFPRLDMDSNPTGEIIPGQDMIDSTNVDPRLGFAWQPTDSGRTVIRGSIGQYSQGTVYGQWYAPPPEVPTWTTYWLNWDNEWEPLWEWAPYPDTFLVDGTKNPSAWEYTLGFEHQVGATSSISAQAVYKKTKNLIGWHMLDDADYVGFEYTDPDSGQVFPLRYYPDTEPTKMKGNTTGPGVVGGDRPYEQEYTGLNLMYKKRFSNNWDMFASYSYYKAWGLNPTFLDGGSQGYTMYSRRSEDNPNSYLNADKTLNSDRRHIFRVVANYMAPWQIKLSTVVNFQTGRPYDRHKWVNVNPPEYAPTHYWAQIIAEPASNSQRYPDQFLWDFSIGKHFSLGKGTNLNIDLKILNILNDDSPEWWRTQEISADEEPIPGEWVLPRRAELRLRFQF